MAKPIPQLEPGQALANLHQIAEAVQLSGKDRDIARASTAVLEQVIAERDRLLAEKEAAPASAQSGKVKGK
jgi:hypothetical protein